MTSSGWTWFSPPILVVSPMGGHQLQLQLPCCYLWWFLSRKYIAKIRFSTSATLFLESFSTIAQEKNLERICRFIFHPLGPSFIVCNIFLIKWNRKWLGWLVSTITSRDMDNPPPVKFSVEQIKGIFCGCGSCYFKRLVQYHFWYFRVLGWYLI